MRKNLIILVASLVASTSVFAADAPTPPPAPQLVKSDGTIYDLLIKSDGIIYDLLGNLIGITQTSH
jgi:hypothetical protein